MHFLLGLLTNQMATLRELQTHLEVQHIPAVFTFTQQLRLSLLFVLHGVAFILSHTPETEFIILKHTEVILTTCCLSGLNRKSCPSPAS